MTPSPEQSNAPKRLIHPDGFVGLEVGRTTVVLGAGGVRLPLMSSDERAWLATELLKLNEERSSLSPPSGTWVLSWFDNETDELVREMPLTDDMRYGEIRVDVPDGQECQIGFRAPPRDSTVSTEEIKPNQEDLP